MTLQLRELGCEQASMILPFDNGLAEGSFVVGTPSTSDAHLSKDI